MTDRQRVEILRSVLSGFCLRDGPRIRCQERSAGRPCYSPATHVARCDPFGDSLTCSECAKFYAVHRTIELPRDLALIIENMRAQASDALLLTKDDETHYSGA